MTRLLGLSAVVAALALPPIYLSGQETDDELGQRIARLIKELDADQFQTREDAEQELLRIGRPAIEILRRTMQSSRGEVRNRCRRILAELNRSIRLVETVRRPDLGYVVSTEISGDGKFLYSASWQAKSICVFSRDQDTGRLTHLQTIVDDDLNGAVCLRLSPSGKLAAAASFRAKTVTLFQRNLENGMLTKKAVFKSDPNGPPLVFPTENAFSPDSRFLFVLDALARNNGRIGALVVFKVTEDGNLKWVESSSGQQSCFHDARGIAFRPGENQFYVTASGANALVTVSWDKDTGKLTIDQDLRDEQHDVHGLAGAMSVAVSKDGKYVYTSSGRFQGDSAIGVFAVQADGTVKVVQELISGRDHVGEFLGGNELLVSQDGKNVYATGTRSATLAGFARDTNTGKLEFIETVPLGGQELGPAGLAIAPNGKYVYVAVEGDSGIAVFRRETQP